MPRRSVQNKGGDNAMKTKTVNVKIMGKLTLKDGKRYPNCGKANCFGCNATGWGE